MKIQLRLSLTISALILALSCGFIASLYFVERSHLALEAETARIDALMKFTTVCRESFLSRDEIGLFNYTKQISRSPGVVSASFVDPQERIIMDGDIALKGSRLQESWTKDIPAQGILRRRRAGPSPSGEILEYAAAVEAAGVRIGFARLSYDPRLVNAQITRALRQTSKRFAGVAVLCLVLGILVAQYTAYIFTLPIRRLTKGVQTIKSGDFTARIDEHRADEIGQLSKEFNNMAARLHELDDLKDQFIQAVSHDLRNPLSAIIMSVEYLQYKNAVKDDGNVLLKNILSSAHTLIGMVTDILDISKMKAGKLTYHKEPVPLESVVTAVYEQYEMLIARKRISLRLNLPPDMPRLNVDAGMIKRVLSNLLSNSAKFTPEGGIITLGAKRDADMEFVTLVVIDTGIGIPAEEIAQVFTRFHQVAQQNKGAIGTGLGLAISKGIIEGHGGKIWVESKEKQGAAFYFTVPIA